MKKFDIKTLHRDDVSLTARQMRSVIEAWVPEGPYRDVALMYLDKAVDNAHRGIDAAE